LFEETTLKELATKSGKSLLLLVIVFLVLDIYVEYIVRIIKTMIDMIKIIFGG